MGGYGSTRWGGHRTAATVEEAKRLPVQDVLRHGPGVYGMEWTRGDRPSGSIGYTVEVRDGHTRVWLSYTVTSRGGEPRPHAYPVDVATVRTAAGLEQRLWRCPLPHNGASCGRLVRSLLLPPGGEYFGCRQCHRLTYRSRQEHDKNDGRRLDMLLARADRLLARHAGPSVRDSTRQPPS